MVGSFWMSIVTQVADFFGRLFCCRTAVIYLCCPIKDRYNSDFYLSSELPSLAVAASYVEVTGDLFHHTLAWLEADAVSMAANATSLMQVNKRF